MRVLFVTSEAAGIYKRGGLGDVSASLPLALKKQGVDVAVAMPFYADINLEKIDCIGQIAVDFNDEREVVFIFQSVLPDSKVPIFLFRHTMLNVYESMQMVNSFAFFSKAVAELYRLAPHTLGGAYDIIHCHDWHTAYVPMILGESKKTVSKKTLRTSSKSLREVETLQARDTKTILTIHNLLYQGVIGISIAEKLGIPESQFSPKIVRTHKVVNTLEEGIRRADIISTVSPTYANEILTPKLGQGIDKLLVKRRKDVVGIVNGIDNSIWNPKTDKALPCNFSPASVINSKANCKQSLQQELKLEVSDKLLFGFIGRIETRQKGVDLIREAVSKLKSNDYQLIILGTGDERESKNLSHLDQKHKNIVFINAFDTKLASRIYAGCDSLLIPSRFEPCGLIQMIAMRYGTLPLARKTGGLADTIKDKHTGFLFDTYSSSALAREMDEVIKFRKDDLAVWQDMVRRVMKQDFSWGKSAGKYLKLYKSLVSK